MEVLKIITNTLELFDGVHHLMNPQEDDDGSAAQPLDHLRRSQVVSQMLVCKSFCPVFFFGISFSQVTIIHEFQYAEQFH